MTIYYVLASEGRGARVPIRKVHLVRRDTEMAARNINHALPRVHDQVFEVNGEGVYSEPELIREHVR
jgi:hypothetical protein